MSKIVVIGGGHGQSTILRGIKQIEDAQISAIVTVADDGGSTGRLRRAFHIPAMGDIRNVMLALAESETVLNDLMNYRFEDPDGTEQDVQGHNLGNLILTALAQQCGNFLDAVSSISKVLNVKGDIIPASPQVISLYAKMKDGVIVKGEANIPTMTNQIEKVFYDRPVAATPQAVKAILEADLIIYGIGSVYTSILPNIIIEDIRQALHQSNALKIYICNAMSQQGETDGYGVEEHVQALLDHGAPVDEVLVANDQIPQEILQRYIQEGSTPVLLHETNHDYKILQQSLLRFDKNLVRHDYNKIKEVIATRLKG